MCERARERASEREEEEEEEEEEEQQQQQQQTFRRSRPATHVRENTRTCPAPPRHTVDSVSPHILIPVDKVCLCLRLYSSVG